MNILQLMPNFKTEDGGDTNPFDLDSGPKGRNSNGPVKTKPLTNGQIRRQFERDQVSRKRKMNRRGRKAWMKNQQDIASLRGQLKVVGALPLGDGSYAEPSTMIYEHLTKVYGSVSAAAAHYKSILDEAA